MRGHIADMDAVMAACDELGLLLVEDCAHALCAAWDGRAIGTFGAAAAFSAQTYKHLNAGEGGFLVLDEDDRAARAILHSGSYMLHAQHRSAPPPEVIAAWEERTPNFSMRMTALAAALLRPQLHDLPRRAERWNAIHDRLGAAIARSQHVPAAAALAQGALWRDLGPVLAAGLRRRPDRRGARSLRRARPAIKWFGAGRQRGFTSAPRHWRYAGEQGAMAQTHAILAGLCDIRTPLSLTDDDCDLAAEILREAIETVVSARAETGKTGRAATG